MPTLKFLALPVLGLSLWFGAAAATIVGLESMSRATEHLQHRPPPPPAVAHHPLVAAQP
jgi:hypothetical protein